MLRVHVERLASWTELETTMCLDDVVKINEVLDAVNAAKPVKP